jgi:uncharacterized protein YeaO (DUF488 family)
MHRPARPFAQPSERQPCRRRGRGARVQLNGLIPGGDDTFTCRAATDTALEEVALDEWCKDVASSTELRKWYGHDPAKFEEFSHRYGAELEQAELAQALHHLRDLAADRRLTLLTASKDADISEAAVLAAILNP